MHGEPHCSFPGPSSPFSGLELHSTLPATLHFSGLCLNPPPYLMQHICAVPCLFKLWQAVKIYGLTYKSAPYTQSCTFIYTVSIRFWFSSCSTNVHTVKSVMFQASTLSKNILNKRMRGPLLAFAWQNLPTVHTVNSISATYVFEGLSFLQLLPLLPSQQCFSKPAWHLVSLHVPAVSC